MATVKKLTHAVRIGLITSLSAAAIIAQPAQAQIGTPSRAAAAQNCAMETPNRASLSAARLVLNGAPSALERIRNQQKLQGSDGAEATPTAAPSNFMRSLVNRPITNSVAPASKTSLKLGEVREAAAADCAIDNAADIANSFRTIRGDRASPMDSRLVAVQRTSFDAEWSRVRRAPPLAQMREALKNAGVSDGMGHEEILARVNRWVNDQVAYQSDDRLYGQRDYWASAEQTLAQLKGDCEDYAILKMHMLRAAGIRPDRMKFTLLRDMAANRDHAFLMVTGASGEHILDNNINRVYAVHEAVAVRPILSFSEDRSWVHAFRNQDMADAGTSAARASTLASF